MQVACHCLPIQQIGKNWRDIGSISSDNRMVWMKLRTQAAGRDISDLRAGNLLCGKRDPAGFQPDALADRRAGIRL
jgi:hypothetical protein